jgi:hypothetical protein
VFFRFGSRRETKEKKRGRPSPIHQRFHRAFEFLVTQIDVSSVLQPFDAFAGFASSYVSSLLNRQRMKLSTSQACTLTNLLRKNISSAFINTLSQRSFLLSRNPAQSQYIHSRINTQISAFSGTTRVHKKQVTFQHQLSHTNIIKMSSANMERGMGGRIEEAFATAKDKGEAAFVSFVTAGFPTPEGEFRQDDPSTVDRSTDRSIDSM